MKFPFFEDGLIKTNEQIFKHFINEIIETHKILKNDKNLKNVVSYITNNIFNKQKLSSQELVVNKKDSILSLCDLSSEKSIFEIKTSSPILLENEKGILKNLNINFIINLIIEKHI